MKKIKILITSSSCIFLILLITSCSKDDSNETISIAGTSWEYTENETTRTITFTSEKYYHYLAVGSHGGDDIKGSYTFSGKIGILTDQYGTIEFFINNNTLTIDYSSGTDEYANSTGTEIFSKKNK